MNLAEELGREAAEGKSRIHLVKYAPKTDAEMLTELTKKQRLTEDNAKRVIKTAKAELRQRKAHEKEREAEIVNASETSDIETVK